MDGREGMTLSGSASYYQNRGGISGSGSSATTRGGISGSGSSAIHGGGGGCSSPTQGGGMHASPVFNIPVHASSGSSFHVQNPSPNFPHGMVPCASQSSEPVKKKRGRPRKYGPDGANMSLGLSTMSGPKAAADALSSGEKARRGRPPGTGWKQKLAPLGEWMNSSAGLAFTPHILHVGIGEDVAEKILAFAQHRPRALCIMSANGSVSVVTLRQPTNSGATLTYEGHFEILCLSGSYLVAENGGPRNRTGGISISICSPDGHTIGGAIGGRLIAANPVQVVACSFVYGGMKSKTKAESDVKDEKYLQEQSGEKSATPAPPGASTQSYIPSSGMNVWPLREVKHSQTDIDLMRG